MVNWPIWKYKIHDFDLILDDDNGSGEDDDDNVTV